MHRQVVVTMPALPMNLTPIWVACDHEFFQEEGLNIELVPVLGRADGEHPRFQWRREGKIVFSSPAGSVPFRSALERRERSDTEINVLSIANRTAHVMVARPAVREASDLAGRRLGADAKGGSGIDARIVLRHFGVNPNEVVWIDSRGKPPDTERYRLELFARDELDAVCCDPPHWHLAVEQGGHRLTSARDLFVLPEAGLGTTPEVIERWPEVIRGMVRATLRGAEFARMNREETLDSITRHNTRITRELAARVWDQVHTDWGPVMEMAAYQRKVDIYTHEWDLPPRPVHAYYDFSFLKEALSELGLLRSWDSQMDLAPSSVR